MQVGQEESEAERVERWRRRELRRAGYTRDAAQVLSICQDVDLHEAVELIESGCPEQVALKILL